MKPGALAIAVNGQPQPLDAAPGSYANLHRAWKDGDVIDVELPMHATVEPLPEADAADHAAILYGPIVLAAPVGTEDQTGMEADAGRDSQVPTGPTLPPTRLPALIDGPDKLSGDLRAVPGKPLTFTLGDAVYPARWSGLRLQPFFRLQETRYVMYWQVTTKDAYDAAAAKK